MAQRLPVLYNKKPCYDIVFQQSFDGLWEELQELGASEKKLCIVTDSRVDELYGAQVAELLEGKCRHHPRYRRIPVFQYDTGDIAGSSISDLFWI